MLRRIGWLSLVLLVPGVAARAQAPNPSFNLVNKTSQPVRELFATPAGMENWGRNRLDRAEIAPGTSHPVRLRADGNCIYDLRVVFADRTSEERRRVDTCKTDDVVVTGGGGAAAEGGSHPPGFRLVNKGSAAVAEVYAVVPPPPGERRRWSDNLLTGGASVAPGDARQFRIPEAEGCRYDLRVVFAGGQSREKKGADLCHTGDLPVQ